MAKKVSVIIPNYNGEELLSHNLPNVIKFCKACEIIIVDDASSDGSVKLIKESYRDIKLIKNSRNLGFARSINIGVESARGDLVLLLNSDVSPREDFLDSALKQFKDKKLFRASENQSFQAGNKQESAKRRKREPRFEGRGDLFAVALADFSHENGKIIKRGRGGAVFEKGFVNHFKLPSEFGETLWVSGGSGLFDKEKFKALGGFDPIYAPFYWEDIDLSFRAWQIGWRCIFEPKSQVDHFHEKGAIKKSSSKFFVKTVSYKNQFIFVWKNIDDYLLIIQHLLWLPYHFTKALINLDFAFFVGFLWAVLKLPVLIFNFSLFTFHFSLSDREVFSKFER